MRTIHVLQDGRDYFIDGIFWGTMPKACGCISRPRACPPTRSRRSSQESLRQGAIASSTRTRRGLPGESVVEEDNKRHSTSRRRLRPYGVCLSYPHRSLL